MNKPTIEQFRKLRLTNKAYASTTANEKLHKHCKPTAATRYLREIIGKIIPHEQLNTNLKDQTYRISQVKEKHTEYLKIISFDHE